MSGNSARRVGQVVARLLHASGHEPTVLDDDPDHVEQSRRFGFRVFYGDATRLDLLEAAGAAPGVALAADRADGSESVKRGEFQPAWPNNACPGNKEAPMITASRQRGSVVLPTCRRIACAADS